MNKKRGFPRKYSCINLKIYQETFDSISLIQKSIMDLTGLGMLKTDVVETAIYLLSGLTPEKIIKEFGKFKKRVDESTSL
jgi:hypothetical protein